MSPRLHSAKKFKKAGSAALSEAIGKCAGVIMKLGGEEAKGQISDIHRKCRGESEKAGVGVHLHTHLRVHR